MPALRLKLAAAGVLAGAAAVPAKNTVDYVRERTDLARLDPAKAARKLNRTKAAPSYRKLGFKSGNDVMGNYLSRKPAVLARNLEGRDTRKAQDPSIRRAAEWWSASSKNVAAVQANPKPRAHYNLKEIATGQAKRELRAARINRMVQAAPRNAPTLWRGTTATPNRIRTIQPGKELRLKPSSWSQDPVVPRYFSQRAAKERPGHKQMVMRLEPRSQSLHIAPATRRKMSEWVSGGRYEVTGMKDKGSTVEVRVRHKGNR